MRKLLALAVLTSLAFAPAVRARPAVAPVTDARAQAALTSKHLVAIGGGRRMNLVCIGHGSPTIVFVDGQDGQMRDWRRIAAGAAKISRACFYDRAGSGFSDPSLRPITAITVTADLHTLLRRAGIKRPAVLVGQGAGGLYATMYADRYWSDIAGLVLIAPAFVAGDNDSRDEAKLAHPFGDMPITVLTADDEAAALRVGRDALAARSVRGVSEVVPNTHGLIQLDQPQAVLDAIADVVGRAHAPREP